MGLTACLVNAIAGKAEEAQSEAFGRVTRLMAADPADNIRDQAVAVHSSDLFDQVQCRWCHGSKYDERAPHDPSILTAHAAMLQSAFPPPDGESQVTADVCRQCHRRVDLWEESAAHLRKQVSVDMPRFEQMPCFGCHGDFYALPEREQVLALHQNSSSFEKAECVKCHGPKWDEHAPGDESILSAHSRMLRVQFPASAEEVTADACRQCHKTVDLLEFSAAHLRKQVFVDQPTFQGQSCVSCHSNFYAVALPGGGVIWIVR
ncbi:MAG: hypothetical protein Kow0059_21440 [Candidatus Sumerlaeia bacterium]